MIVDLLKRAWMKYGVGISRMLYADDLGRLERAYAVPDPWNMGSEQERRRFELINDFIRRRCGAVGRALELGSGEGHHTERLLEVCGEVDGIETCARAVERAKLRCPRARFLEAGFPTLPAGLRPPYDLVIASETLYYIKDVAAAVSAMERLGRRCLVTFYRDQVDRLSPFFDGIPGAVHEDLSSGRWTWRLYLWEPPRRA